MNTTRTKLSLCSLGARRCALPQCRLVNKLQFHNASNINQNGRSPCKMEGWSSNMPQIPCNMKSSIFQMSQMKILQIPGKRLLFFLCLYGLDGFACFLSSWCCKALWVSWLHGFVCVHLFTATTAASVRKSQTQPTPKQRPQHQQLLVCSSSYTTTTTTNNNNNNDNDNDNNNNNNNKATGWLAALVRVTNLKLRFSKLRDKMLVFVGLVKKCLQHGHSFRLAGAWRNLKNAFRMRGESILIFECWKNIGNLWFSSFPCKHPPDHPPIFLISAKVLSAKPRPQTQTRRHYDAMSSCKPKSIFFGKLLGFLVQHRRWCPFFPWALMLHSSRTWSHPPPPPPCWP